LFNPVCGSLGLAFIFGLFAIQSRAERNNFISSEEDWSRFRSQQLSRSDLSA